MPRVVVIGASFAGLFAAAASAAAGGEVTLVERDVLEETPEPRRGVPQGRQPHVLLHRGLLAMQHLMPGLAEDLVAAGARRIDTGHLPWLTPLGWMPPHDTSYDIHSLSRPLLELLVRRHVLSLPGVTLRQGVRVDGLSRTTEGWEVQAAGGSIRADVVVDASGRTSRLPRWLAELGIDVPDVQQVEARLGYASRRYRNPGTVNLRTAVVVLASPDRPRGGMALPVEDDRWLVLENGYGDQRPGRDAAAFSEFLTTLPDPALSQLVAAMEPEGDVAVHRQTGNQRRAYGRRGAWPRGLLVLGDALSAFNPIYGQGISVAACQAEVLREALPDLRSDRSTRRWQARLTAITDFPWAVATSEDRGYAGADGRRSAAERLTGLWTDRVVRLALGGDEVCLSALADAYHLMGSPTRMFSPRVGLAVLRSLGRGVGEPPARPAQLESIVGPEPASAGFSGS